MQYVTSVEKNGIQQGVRQGIQQGQAELVLRSLGRCFGAVPLSLAAQVRNEASEQMPDLLDAILAAGSLEEAAAAVEAIVAAAGRGNSARC